MKLCEVQEHKEHPIWKNDDAQAALANAAIFAAIGYSKNNDTPKYTALHADVAQHALKRFEKRRYLDDRAHHGAKDACEKFRRFLHRETAHMTDAVFLDCLASFLFLEEKGHPVKGKKDGNKIWTRYIKSISGLYDIDRAVKSLSKGSFDYSEKAYQEYDPGSDLNRIAEEFFNVTDDDFKLAASILTGYKEVSERATWLQKGYWSCYRLSGSKKERIVKTRLIVTPPEPQHKYCRFENISGNPVSGKRDARGVVLPVGRKLYLIGSFIRPGIGAKIIYLSEPDEKAQVTSGLLMSTGLGGDDKPIISRVVVTRETPEDVVRDIPEEERREPEAESYERKRDDLKEYPLNSNDPSLLLGSGLSNLERIEVLSYIRRNILNFDPELINKLDENFRFIVNKAIRSGNDDA